MKRNELHKMADIYCVKAAEKRWVYDRTTGEDAAYQDFEEGFRAALGYVLNKIRNLNTCPSSIEIEEIICTIEDDNETKKES